jgi:hypothetical protein
MTKSKSILPPRQWWFPDEEQYLREHYADTLTVEIAEFLGRKVEHVRRKALDLGLKKSPEHLAVLARERSGAPDHGGKATRFAPGLKPWNTGIKGVSGVQPECRATQFKPGNVPPKAAPIGALRLCDGCLQRKVANHPGGNHLRWRSVHELVWIEANGPVPAGHLVVFKPGRRTTQLEHITLDAVELVSRADHMRNNTIHRYGPEVASVMKLRASIRKEISAQAEEATNPS